MAILFSKEFGIPKEIIIHIGVFDVLLDEDSHFFINIKRLQATEVPEFIGAYDKINDYFRDIGLLLKESRIGDKLYRTALNKFNFPEVNGINLGFSSGNHGAGFGLKLREQIIRDAYEIIKTGSDQPEIFHLTSLFEDNVGPDRLSDMVARLVYTNIIEYTKRIYQDLNITQGRYPDYIFRNEIPQNPYKKHPILLLPLDILHELPIARCWDDIDRFCRENEAIRAEINELVGSEWSKMASSDKKRYMRELVFKNPNRLDRIVDSYRETKVDAYNVFSDVDYLVGALRSTLMIEKSAESTSYEAAERVISNYREWVELHRGANLIYDTNSRSKEKVVQRTLHAVALMYCKENNWDINPEVDSGRGPVDFKISRGTDKTVMEIKLSSNRQCVHGLEVQIEEYAKSEGTDNKLFILVNTGENEKHIELVDRKRQEMITNGLSPAKIIVIDARPKVSASVF